MVPPGIASRLNPDVTSVVLFKAVPKLKRIYVSRHEGIYENLEGRNKKNLNALKQKVNTRKQKHIKREIFVYIAVIKNEVLCRWLLVHCRWQIISPDTCQITRSFKQQHAL
jgi:hypothetical protein